MPGPVCGPCRGRGLPAGSHPQELPAQQNPSGYKGIECSILTATFVDVPLTPRQIFDTSCMNMDPVSSSGRWEGSAR